MDLNYSCKGGNPELKHRRRKRTGTFPGLHWPSVFFNRHKFQFSPNHGYCHLLSHSHCAPGLLPSISPTSPGELGHSPGPLFSERMAQPGSLVERHLASLLLIAIQSRQSSPRDLNAIFSLNYAKSFREGGEII